MIIIFKNWKKWQGRNDVDHPTWFRFYNNMITHELWDELDHEEFRCFVYLLCRASAENDQGSYQAQENNFTRSSGLGAQVLHRTVKKLKSLQVVETRTLRGRYTGVTDALHECNADLPYRERERDRKIACVPSNEVHAELLPLKEIFMDRKISLELQNTWISLYSKDFIVEKVRALKAWELTAGAKGKKSNWGKFYTTCFARDWDQWSKRLPSAKKQEPLSYMAKKIMGIE